MKLRNKIYMYSSVLFAVLLIIINLAVYYVFRSVSMDSELERLRSEMPTMVRSILRIGGAVPSEELLRAYVPIDGMIRIVTPNGFNDPPAVTTLEEQRLVEQEVIYYNEQFSQIKHVSGQAYAFVSTPMIWADGQVINIQITESLQKTEQNLQALRIVLTIVTAFAMIPVLLSSRLLSSIIIQPIVTMIRTMTDIRRSGQFKRLELQGQSNDELVQMKETFNEMMDLLEDNYQKQEQFVSNASHELKTPITIIESYANLLKRRGQEHPEVLAESIEAIHSEAIRMNELTEQLLMLAKRDEQWNITLELLNLEELIIVLAKAYEQAYRRQLQLTLGNGAEGYADRQKLKQLIIIFLDNARKYSDDIISIRVESQGKQSCIRITDRGIGISKEDLPKVFDRFYRVDKARGRTNGGYGLGLSLARDIADAMGVQIEMESIEGEGTSVTIRLQS